MSIQEKQCLLPYARGEKKAALVLKNAQIINVFSQTIQKGNVALQNGYIVGVGTSYEGEKEIDLAGRYLAPGFIDAHIHLESAMVSPRLLAAHIVPWGTTTVIADPHEIANVAGLAGIQYLLDASAELPLQVYMMFPACVPATAGEENGATLTVADWQALADEPRLLGLGEVMDFPAVIAGEDSIWQKLVAARKRPRDGHAPGLSGQALQAYLLSGIHSDHECATYAEAKEKLMLGCHILLREGSAAKNLTDILSEALKDKIPLEHFAFCTDDKQLADIAREGHIRWNIKKAIDLGVPPPQAIAMATIQPAQWYGLAELGAIAPGYQGDLVVLDDLREVTIHSVYQKGQCVATGVAPLPFPPSPPHFSLCHTVHIKPLQAKDLVLPAQKNFPAIRLVPGQIITREERRDLPGQEGVFQPQDDLLKLVVVERHRASGHFSLGVLAGFGLKKGAIASTVAHDSHNLVVAGDNDADILLAITELCRCQGGYTIVSDGQVLQTLPLPIAGLFHDSDTFETANLADMVALAHRLGVPADIDPFVSLSFLALPVIPELRLTTQGLYNVVTAGLL